MTLENCKRLLKLYKEKGDEVNAKIFEERILRKGGSIEDKKEEVIEEKTKSKGKYK